MDVGWRRFETVHNGIRCRRHNIYMSSIRLLNADDNNDAIRKNIRINGQA